MNLGTFVVLLVVVAIAGLALRSVLKSGGCNCSDCSCSSTCASAKNDAGVAVDAGLGAGVSVSAEELPDKGIKPAALPACGGCSSCPSCGCGFAQK